VCWNLREGIHTETDKALQLSKEIWLPMSYGDRKLR
jgi:hypothetical protein